MDAPRMNLNDPEFVSVLDELPLWSAPFGIRLLDRAPMNLGMNALDIGCGTGFPLIELAMRLGKSSRVYGIDPWKEALYRVQDKIKAWGISNAEVVEGQAENLPFEDHFFDLIVSNNGLNNVSDLASVLGECKRVGKPGSRLIFTMNTHESMMEFYNIMEAVLLEKKLNREVEAMREHIRIKRPDEERLVDLMKTKGIQTISTEHDQFILRYTNGSALLAHGFIRLAFLPAWMEIIEKKDRNFVFAELEARMNKQSELLHEFRLTIPYTLFECAL
jgi:arsenite methyltransferase